MNLSIVIPAFNEEKLLGRTLEQIRVAAGAWEVQSRTWELIVCDNNSTDRTAEIAREHGATVVFEPHNQIGRARNTGARMAQGEWLIFIDADSLPSRELFAAMIKQMDSGRVVGGGATVDMRHEFPIAGYLVGFWNGISRLARWAAGSFLFCRREAFEAVGGFDERFYASEEIGLSQALKREGKSRGESFVILTRHPLQTSARKWNLYSPLEIISLLVRAAILPGPTTRNKKHCTLWYDGRR